MTAAPVDPRFALDAANASEMVQKKLSIDAMRKRVSGGVDEEKKLRESCEGFESIFLQKMWEQMRKNVKKEGYLHSKDEESYQSMFDTELSKKMASAGGIGLADMLYEQLSRKLTNASKTTGAGALRSPLPIDPARAAKPEPAAKAENAPAPENLYSEMEEELPAAPEHDLLRETLSELAASRDPSLDPANASYPMFDLRTGEPLNALAEKQKEESAPKREYMVTPLPERVNAPGKARPSNALNGVGRSARHTRRKTAQPEAINAEKVEAASTRRMLRNEPEEFSREISGQVTGQVTGQQTGEQAGEQTGRALSPPEDTAAFRENPMTPDSGSGGADWATSGDMVSVYHNQARNLHNSGRKPWSRTA